tara:strand:- start:186 stop:308 length:123 start_codon:yes stop_codon:yes gene_type:complete
MDLGSLIALLKLAQDAEVAPKKDLYTKEKALFRAESGLGL